MRQKERGREGDGEERRKGGRKTDRQRQTDSGW